MLNVCVILEGVLELNITDCNNPVATMSAFFGPSCVPGALDYRHNPRSTNPDQLCRACRPSRDTENSSWCSSNDPYAGTDGVLNCLVHGSGDVAFMSAEAVLKLSPSTAAMFKFVCPDGRTAPVTPLSVCSWGAFPSDAFVTDSAKPSEEKAFLQMFLGNLTRTAAKIFSDRLPGTNEKRYECKWTQKQTESGMMKNYGDWFLLYADTASHPRTRAKTVGYRLTFLFSIKIKKCLL